MTDAASPRLPFSRLRDGVSASTWVLPQLHEFTERPANLLSFLEHPTHNPQGLDWENRLKNGLVCDENGQALPLSAPYIPGQRIYYWRDAGPEPRIPFNEQIIYQDEHILVADKPHFLPVTPTGRYVQETLLVRLRKRTGLADLAPIHRIDRDTAGLVLFSVQAQERGAYMALFRQRQVHKVYECIAPVHPSLQWPLTRRSRLENSPASFMQMMEIPDAPGIEPNSETHIECIEQQGPWARYRLQPLTGKRHQLRVHMLALGLPIRGDAIYPVLQPEPAPETMDYSQPLQLLAQELGLIDPLTGQEHRFVSARRLAL